MDGGGYGKAQRGRRHRTPAAGRPYQAARPRPTPVVEEPLLELAGNVEPARQSLLMTLLSNPLRLMAKVRVGGPTSCLLAGTSGPCSHHLIDRDWCLQVPVLGSYFAAAAAAVGRCLHMMASRGCPAACDAPGGEPGGGGPAGQPARLDLARGGGVLAVQLAVMSEGSRRRHRCRRRWLHRHAKAVR